MTQWLRCCTTNRKVAGSIPDGVIGIFHGYNAGVDSAPGEFPGGKCGRCVRLKTLPPPCAVFMKPKNFNFLEHSGPLQASNGTALPFTDHLNAALQIGMTSVQECWLGEQ